MIIDAWFGFQPARDARGSACGAPASRESVEIWCHAPPDLIAARYRDRAGDRLPGHPGPEYAEELHLLAGRAEPMRLGPVLRSTQVVPLDPLP